MFVRMVTVNVSVLVVDSLPTGIGLRANLPRRVLIDQNNASRLVILLIMICIINSSYIIFLTFK